MCFVFAFDQNGDSLNFKSQKFKHKVIIRCCKDYKTDLKIKIRFTVLESCDLLIYFGYTF